MRAIWSLLALVVAHIANIKWSYLLCICLPILQKVCMDFVKPLIKAFYIELCHCLQSSITIRLDINALIDSGLGTNDRRSNLYLIDVY